MNVSSLIASAIRGGAQHPAIDRAPPGWWWGTWLGLPVLVDPDHYIVSSLTILEIPETVRDILRRREARR